MIWKLGMKHQGEELYKVYINHDLGMALTYSIWKLGMKHQGEELYKVYINHDLGMALTYSMARST